MIKAKPDKALFLVTLFAHTPKAEVGPSLGLWSPQVLYKVPWCLLFLFTTPPAVAPDVAPLYLNTPGPNRIE